MNTHVLRARLWAAVTILVRSYSFSGDISYVPVLMQAVISYVPVLMQAVISLTRL